MVTAMVSAIVVDGHTAAVGAVDAEVKIRLFRAVVEGQAGGLQLLVELLGCFQCGGARLLEEDLLSPCPSG